MVRDGSGRNVVAVGIDKGKNSQYAFRWAIDHLLIRGQTITLVHVKPRPSTITPTLSEEENKLVAKAIQHKIDNQVKEVLTPFHAFCTSKDIKAKEVILEGTDIANVICNYVKVNLVDSSSWCPIKGRLYQIQKTECPLLHMIFRTAQMGPISPGHHHLTRMKLKLRSGGSSKQELKQTMDMYNTACRDALTAKQKQATELHRWKMEKQNRAKQSLPSKETTMAIIEKERAKAKAAIEAAEAAQKKAELEAKKRINAEKNACKVAEKRRKVEEDFARNNTIGYRKYSIEEIEVATDNFASSRKVGKGGGYGPVYKCYLDHTPVAVKVLRPDAAQGRSQFQEDVQLQCLTLRFREHISRVWFQI